MFKKKTRRSGSIAGGYMHDPAKDGLTYRCTLLIRAALDSGGGKFTCPICGGEAHADYCGGQVIAYCETCMIAIACTQSAGGW